MATVCTEVNLRGITHKLLQMVEVVVVTHVNCFV